MEEWFKTACDGFVLSATRIPGTYEDMARLVVPELQRRGLFRTRVSRHDPARYAGAATAGDAQLAHRPSNGGGHDHRNFASSRRRACWATACPPSTSGAASTAASTPWSSTPGSTDPGPYMLGLGHTLVPRESYARDVSLMLKAAYERKIPLIISSAGGAGTDAQVDFMIDLIRELSAANGYKFKLAAIYSSVDRRDDPHAACARAASPNAGRPAISSPRPSTRRSRSWRRSAPSPSPRSWPNGPTSTSSSAAAPTTRRRTPRSAWCGAASSPAPTGTWARSSNAAPPAPSPRAASSRRRSARTASTSSR